MKYLNFRSRASKLESITCTFTKSHTPSEVFSEEFSEDGCFWGQLYFRNTPQWLLLKDSCKDIFILEILGYTCFTFLTLTSCQRGTNFYEYFLSEGFSEKCKHTESALNFTQKQYFSQKTHFPFIILKQQHREPSKICF